MYRFNRPRQPSWGDTDDANARIGLFWGVIGLVSRHLGVSVAGLTVKVLAHELAHAYSHAYEKLLPHQPEIYRTHLGWLERHSPEQVREAMLTIRCREAGSLAEFEWLLGESRTRRRNR